jgi:hypothetical protein
MALALLVVITDCVVARSAGTDVRLVANQVREAATKAEVPTRARVAGREDEEDDMLLRKDLQILGTL